MNKVLLFLALLGTSTSEKISSYVVGGRDAEISEFPFMVSLRRLGVHFCGATILNEFWLLTVKQSL